MIYARRRRCSWTGGSWTAGLNRCNRAAIRAAAADRGSHGLTCNAGCGKPAAYRPVLVVYAKGWPRDTHPPARGEIGLNLCVDCRLLTTREDLICDEGWRQIVDGFRQAGWAEPDRAALVRALGGAP